jgi:hypothetical protein
MASPIDPTTARSLISEYQTQNSASGGPALKTPDGSFLKGFFIDRSSLDTILSNPDVTGVSVHLAKEPASQGSSDNIFTILFAGATGTEPPFDRDGDIYGAPPPCPPWCMDI